MFISLPELKPVFLFFPLSQTVSGATHSRLVFPTLWLDFWQQSSIILSASRFHYSLSWHLKLFHSISSFGPTAALCMSPPPYFLLTLFRCIGSARCSFLFILSCGTVPLWYSSYLFSSSWMLLQKMAEAWWLKFLKWHDRISEMGAQSGQITWPHHTSLVCWGAIVYLLVLQIIKTLSLL